MVPSMSEKPTIGMQCIKFLLCLANFLFILTALLIISVGSTIYAVYDDFERFLEDNYFSPASMLIIIGIIILIVSLFGFIGTLKESTCMIMLFSTMLGVILILELAAAIAAFSIPGGITTIVHYNLNNVMQNYKNGTEDAVALDFLQTRLDCCGCYGKDDWKDIYPINETRFGMPVSCCIPPTNIINEDLPMDSCLARQSGCLNKLTHLVYQSSIMLGTGALSIALVQVLGMLFACMLGQSIRKAKTMREVRRRQLTEDLIRGNNYTQLSRGDVKIPVLYTPSSTDA